ncbi:ribonuclease P protein component [bacterium]|nr:ribonuclease P protein component [bacterium]
MKLSPKQIIGQKILSHHKKIKVDNITLMYTPRESSDNVKKPCIIVSVSKKISPTAVARNYNKRILRQLLRDTLKKDVLTSYNWMWICKERTVTVELKEQLQNALMTLTT